MANEQLPTPSPSPPLALEPTLPTQINIATRTQHTKLNRMITGRLPLALPPLQKTPALYTQGLQTFAAIYFVLEQLWTEICDEPSQLRQEIAECSNLHELEILEWLSTLLPAGLRRSQRLEEDLQHLCDCANMASPVHSAANTTLRRMSTNLKAKPHTFIAYTWVMYMAVFSGGRWIRNQLAKGGPEFWLQQAPVGDGGNLCETVLSYPGFEFLSFEGEEDGEDIKSLFKARLAEAETLLTPDEKRDVVEAAKDLFGDLICVVQLLDR